MHLKHDRFIMLYNEKIILSVRFIEMLEETSILSFRFFFLPVYLSGQSVHENIVYQTL